MLRNFLLAGVTLATPSFAFAQAPDPVPAAAADDGSSGAPATSDAAAPDAPQAQGGESRADDSNDIVVTGSRIRGPDVLAHTTAVSGEELARYLRP